MCQSRDECPNEVEPVCGNDGISYENECYLKAATCGREIEMKQGRCGESKDSLGLPVKNKNIKEGKKTFTYRSQNSEFSLVLWQLNRGLNIIYPRLNSRQCCPAVSLVVQLGAQRP